MAQILNLGNVIGPPGITGPAGATGAKGVDGATWLFGDTAPTTQGKTGDFYLNTANFDLYSKSTGIWVKIGSIKGTKGDTGVKGDTGAVPTFSVNDAGHLIATYT